MSTVIILLYQTQNSQNIFFPYPEQLHLLAPSFGPSISLFLTPQENFRVRKKKMGKRGARDSFGNDTEK